MECIQRRMGAERLQNALQIRDELEALHGVFLVETRKDHRRTPQIIDQTGSRFASEGAEEARG